MEEMSSVASGNLYWIKGWMDAVERKRERERRKEGIAEKEQKRAHWNSMVYFVSSYLNAANEKNIYNSFRKFAQLGITLNNTEIFCEIHFCE